MSKKHFIALADAIREANSHYTDPKGYPFNEQTVEALADFCADQNENFKRDRWLGYIAGTNGKNGGTR